MLRYIRCLIAAVFVLSCSSVFAEPKVGPYFGLQSGIGGIDTPNFSSKVKDEVKILPGSNYSQKNSWGWTNRVFVGYLWKYNKLNYGLEAGGMFVPQNKYHLFLKVPDEKQQEVKDVTFNMRYKSYAIDLLGVLKYYLQPRFNLFLQEGVAYTYQKYEGLVSVAGNIHPLIPSSDTLKTTTRFLPEVALGCGWQLAQHLELNLSYRHIFGNEISFDGDDSRTKAASLDGAMLGITIS